MARHKRIWGQLLQDVRGTSVLRIHFSAEDLVRTRIARGPHLMWELVLSAQLLQNREGVVAFRDWRQRVRPLLPTLTPLLELAPHAPYFPDFLTLGGGRVDVDEAIAEVLSTSRRRLRAEVEILGRQQRLSSWIRDIGDGAAAAISTLGDMMRRYHQAMIEPFWSTIVAHVDADRSLRSRAVLDGGVEGLLESLRPMIRWSSGVLEADYPRDHDLYLQGRGLLLVPSYFCWRAPVTLADAGLQPVLVYPVAHDLRRNGNGASDQPGRRLGALIGRTRAGVLHAIEDGCTTSELGRRARVSVASASQHASVLRDAGLIATQRYGSSVLHTLTPLGSSLLHGEPRGFASPPRSYEASEPRI